MTDKIRIEDMSFCEIRELKHNIRLSVAEALSTIYKEVTQRFDCGHPLITAITTVNVDEYEDEDGELLDSKEYVTFDIDVRFTKEDD